MQWLNICLWTRPEQLKLTHNQIQICIGRFKSALRPPWLLWSAAVVATLRSKSIIFSSKVESKLWRVQPFYPCKYFAMATPQNSCETEYARSWSFRTQLTMPPIPPGNQHSVDITTQILRTQILPARPDRVTHIEARYKSAESSGAVLSLEGYLQHSSGINRYQLDRWFHAS